jgi:hypothetical protein
VGVLGLVGARDLLAVEKMSSAVLSGKRRVQSSPSNSSVLDKLGLPLLIGATLVGQKNLVDAGKVCTSLACLVAAGGNLTAFTGEARSSYAMI